MVWFRVETAPIGQFHNAGEIHHGNAMADVLNDRKIMGK
jgi:hypothetical protein